MDIAPRFDGLIAANGRLYVTTRDNQILCLSAEMGKPLRKTPAKAVAQSQ